MMMVIMWDGFNWNIKEKKYYGIKDKHTGKFAKKSRKIYTVGYTSSKSVFVLYTSFKRRICMNVYYTSTKQQHKMQLIRFA